MFLEGLWQRFGGILWQEAFQRPRRIPGGVRRRRLGETLARTLGRAFLEASAGTKGGRLDFGKKLKKDTIYCTFSTRVVEGLGKEVFEGLAGVIGTLCNELRGKRGDPLEESRS